jgi:MFS family permease
MFATMSSTMGAGAVVGGLMAASRVTQVPVLLARSALIFGTIQILVSISPNVWLAYALLVVLGGCSVTFISTANTTLQLSSDPEMRGRVMGLYVLGFFGTTPFGGPLMGWIGEHFSPRWSLAVGGITLILAAIYALPRLGREPLVGGVSKMPPPPAKITD